LIIGGVIIESALICLGTWSAHATRRSFLRRYRLVCSLIGELLALHLTPKSEKFLFRGSGGPPSGWPSIATRMPRPGDQPQRRWRSPFGVAEHRNSQDSSAFGAVAIVWRSPFGVAEHRNAQHGQHISAIGSGGHPSGWPSIATTRAPSRRTPARRVAVT